MLWLILASAEIWEVGEGEEEVSRRCSEAGEDRQTMFPGSDRRGAGGRAVVWHLDQIQDLFPRQRVHSAQIRVNPLGLWLLLYPG